ncbi:MAG: hypothetical protein ACI9FN_003864 [Saprospiraceae bacterium]|jgi:hypothetical protein
MNIREFIEECRKRNIFRSISIYVISVWLIIQVVATTFPFLGIPKLAVTVIIICCLLGLPFIMLFSWYYNLKRAKAGKLVFENEEEHPNQMKGSLFQKVFFHYCSYFYWCTVSDRLIDFSK